jgi:uncharacterized protein (TIGR03435 family)
MAQRWVTKVSIGKKLLLAALGAVSVAGPIVFGHVNAPQIRAQSGPTADAVLPSFEVASVRLIPPGSRGLFSLSKSGMPRLTVRNTTLRVLVEMAFAVPRQRTKGAPNWFDSQLYDIDAKVEGDKGLTYEQMRPLIQQLLKDRFHLATHREMEVQKAYALVIAKRGPKLQRSKGTSQYGQVLPNQLYCPSCSLERLARILEQVTGRPVVDKTGIKGDFDIKLEFAPETASDSSLPSIFTALQEQLGLKLIPQEVPVEMVVIDHVERIPTEN